MKKMFSMFLAVTIAFVCCCPFAFALVPPYWNIFVTDAQNNLFATLGVSNYYQELPSFFATVPYEVDKVFLTAEVFGRSVPVFPPVCDLSVGENKIDISIEDPIFLVGIYNCGTLTITRESAGILVTLNGTPMEFDVAPIIVNNRTMVPFRAIFEALEMEIDWDDDTKTAIGVKENLRIEIPIDNTTAFVNGETVELDVPAMLHNSRTMVPVRFVAENSGASVEWDDEMRTVLIYTY